MKPFKAVAYIFVCCILFLTACTNQTGTVPTAKPGDVTPGQGAAAPNATGENSQPQQQTNSSIGALPPPTGAGVTGNNTNAGGSTTENAPTESAVTQSATEQPTQAVNTQSAAAGTENTTNNQACALLTTQDIETVLQTPVNAGKIVGNSTTGLTTCEYTGTDATLSAKVDVTIYEGNQAEIAASNADNGTAVPNLGDQAYQSANSVYVRIDTRWILVGVSGSDNLAVKPADAALGLAHIAAGKLAGN